MAARALPPRLRVAIAWDQSSRVAFSQVAMLVNSESTSTSFVAPGFTQATGNLLDDQIMPAIEEAGSVLVLWADNDPLWLGFQAGLASGMGRPWKVLAARHEAASAQGIPGAIEAFASSDELLRLAQSPFPEGDPSPDVTAEPILLCPRETAGDLNLYQLVKAADSNRTWRQIGPRGSALPASANVVWVITSHGVGEQEESNLRPNLGNAFEAGRCYGAVLASGDTPELSIVRVGAVPPITALEHLTRLAESDAVAATLLATTRPGPIRLTRVELRELKCFTSINIPLSIDSPLGGAWTCLAGVNGVGKSTVLQAAAVALLGRKRAPELGLARLARMVRRSGLSTRSGPPSTEIRVTVDDGTGPRDIVLPLTTSGIDDRRLASMSDQSAIEQLWERLDKWLVVSYGATRNISDTPSGALSMSQFAHRQLTLFDPLAQIVSTEALTVGGPRFRPILETVAHLVTAVLDEPHVRFESFVVDDQLVFQREGATLNSVDLPDGFRSVLAMLADIASGWHQIHPLSAGVKGSDIEGIVLVDELDLHLHARLQRMIVPRLRKALPKVQWIITTHSPYIAGSFDRTEIVLLDRDEPTGIRTLDRQVLAFSANELYDWLLGVPIVSEAGEEEIAKDSGTALLYQSPNRDEKAAKKLLAEQDELLNKLRSAGA